MGNSYKCVVSGCEGIVNWHSTANPGVFACDEHADIQKSESMTTYIQNIASTIKF